MGAEIERAVLAGPWPTNPLSPRRRGQESWSRLHERGFAAQARGVDSAGDWPEAAAGYSTVKTGPTGAQRRQGW